jgi:Tfp pilus assembly PilM family ATPase
MAVDHHIGLEIAENGLRLVELRVNDGFPFILRADEITTRHAYGTALLHSTPYDRDLAKEFVRDVATLVHRHPFLSARVSIVLPPLVPLIATIPVDAHLSAAEQRQHIMRECKQLTSLGDNAQVSVLSFPLARADAAVNNLAVSLPQPTVDFLKAVFSHLTFEVHSIDIDHFVIERAAQRLYKEHAASTCGMLGLSATACTASITRGDAYFGFRVSHTSYKQQYLAHALSQLSTLLQSRARASLDALMLFGDERCEEYHPVLESVLDIPVHRFLPSRHIAFYSAATAEEAERHPPHVFTAAAAAAWNGLS